VWGPGCLAEGRGGEDGLTVHARLACPGLLDGLVPALAGLVTGSVVLFTAASTEEVGTFPARTLDGLDSFAPLDTLLAIDVVDDVVFAFYMGGRVISKMAKYLFLMVTFLHLFLLIRHFSVTFRTSTFINTRHSLYKYVLFSYF